MRLFTLLVLSQLIGLSVLATVTDLDIGIAKLAGQYSQVGGDLKALSQVRCFLKTHGQDIFRPKQVAGPLGVERCNLKETIQLTNYKSLAVINFTKNSDHSRLHIFDLTNGKVHALHVGHGRFGQTDRDNTTFSEQPKRNSILQVKHFSNDKGSNASAGGFFLTGHEYEGSYGRSRVLHGLEQGINDNACERTTVIHKSGMVSENATRRMSSGCPMVSRERINQVHALLGEGALVYTFTPEEASLSDGICGRNLLR